MRIIMLGGIFILSLFVNTLIAQRGYIIDSKGQRIDGDIRIKTDSDRISFFLIKNGDSVAKVFGPEDADSIVFTEPDKSRFISHLHPDSGLKQYFRLEASGYINLVSFPLKGDSPSLYIIDIDRKFRELENNSIKEYLGILNHYLSGCRPEAPVFKEMDYTIRKIRDAVHIINQCYGYSTYIASEAKRKSEFAIEAGLGVFKMKVGETYDVVEKSSYESGQAFFLQASYIKSFAESDNNLKLKLGFGFEKKSISTVDNNMLESSNGLISNNVDLNIRLLSLYTNPELLYCFANNGGGPVFSVGAIFGYCLNSDNSFKLLIDGEPEDSPYFDIKSMYDVGITLGLGHEWRFTNNTGLAFNLKYRIEKLSFELSHSRLGNQLAYLSVSYLF